MTISVLVVDDSATVRYQLVQQLREAEIDAQEARNGEEALELLRGESVFDVIISDLKMPGIDGLTLVNALQEDGDLSGIPICILTSSTDLDDHVQNLEAGASAFIQKPWKEEVLVATVRRLARVRESTSRLERASRTDPLTGLSNRRHGDATLRQEMDRSRRYGGAMAVALLDIDHFKSINDSISHAAGDDVLKWLARELRAVSRKTDTVVRWGGEEFLFIFPETNLDEAAAIVERFRSHLAETPVSIETAGGRELSVTVSGGVAELESEDTTDSLVDRADSALYKAKETGRNRLLKWQDGELHPVVAA